MNSIRCLAVVSSVALSLVAFAQEPLPNGTSAAAASTCLQYRSAFERYRASQEPRARSWREANEKAASLGVTPGISNHDVPGQGQGRARSGKPGDKVLFSANKVGGVFTVTAMIPAK